MRRSGKGTLTSESGQVSSVNYYLDELQGTLRADSMQGRSEIAGMKRIEGRVWPIVVPLGEAFVLELEDGLKLKLFYTDSRGTIALVSWLG